MLQSHDDLDSVDRTERLLLILSYLKISNVGKLLVKSVNLNNIMRRRRSHAHKIYSSPLDKYNAGVYNNIRTLFEYNCGVEGLNGGALLLLIIARIVGED